MTPDRRAFLRTSGLMLAGALAGCAGGSDGGGGTPAATTTETPSPTPTPSPTETPTTTSTPEPAPAQERYPNYQWSKLDGVQPVATSDIRMRAFEFHPLIAAVEPGTEVTVTNEDGNAHSITVPMLSIDERVAGGGGSVSFAVDRTGTFDYVCTFHPTLMLGRLVVTEDLPTATPTPTTEGTSTPSATHTHTETTTSSGSGGY